MNPVAVRQRPGRARARLALLGATAGVLAAGLAGLGVGEVAFTPWRVAAVLLGDGSPLEALMVQDLRLPRIVLGAVAGASLGIAGAVTQTTARNALASPDLLGVTAGAGAGAVAAIVLGGGGAAGPGVLGTLALPGAALVGGLVAAALVGVLLRVGGGRGLRPVLLGVAVSTFFSSLTSWMLIEASIDDVERATAWLTGSLGGGRSWPEVLTVAGALLVATALMIPARRGLDGLQLGLDVARSIGVRVPRTVAVLLGSAVLVTAVTVSAVGPIGFIALVAPHLAHLVSGTSRPPLVASGLVGAGLLLAGDLVARTVIPAFTVPTGAVTALVGAPFLVYLLVRRAPGGSR
ncbi:FecCD family ABC transporter permease [Clavibacter zhangzhiyongii]|uniref:FecCD family ABC transporter permease n=1 Tax=Clavibacter zhangzhiyongii TaxID=2768071 RepID=UPI001BB3C75C|nr:iron ABC transporter permease [Clavibacter zhangzhiyongii]